MNVTGSPAEWGRHSHDSTNAFTATSQHFAFSYYDMEISSSARWFEARDKYKGISFACIFLRSPVKHSDFTRLQHKTSKRTLRLKGTGKMGKISCSTCYRYNASLEPIVESSETREVSLSNLHADALTCKICAFVKDILSLDPTTPNLTDESYGTLRLKSRR